jgi:lysine 2,3-aminomutase
LFSRIALKFNLKPQQAGGMMYVGYKSTKTLKDSFNISILETTSLKQTRHNIDKNSGWLPSKLFTKQISDLINDLRKADSVIYKILLDSRSLQDTREEILTYLNIKEWKYFDLLSPEGMVSINIIERNNAKECIRVFRNIIRTENEILTGFSALQVLRNAVQSRNDAAGNVTHAFLCEIVSLILGINGKGLSFLSTYKENNIQEIFPNHENFLDNRAAVMNQAFKRFYKGTDPVLVLRQESQMSSILEYCGGIESDWKDYRWHLKNIFSTKNAIASVVHLDPNEIAGLELAEQEHIPVQITPYYLSLFNPDGRDESDRAIRAQVLPTVSYCKTVASNRLHHTDMDYMGEHFTSPIEGITRRYPEIVILKLFDSCPQICVYCQRNWEIRDIYHAAFNESKFNLAIKWIENQQEIKEVLVTGGDPLTMGNTRIGNIVDRLAEIDHVERIRIASRTLVTMPHRIDEGLLKILQAYHVPGKLEIAFMTHVEHSTELTPAVIEAATKIKKCGISIYNQQVFTYYNSRKFETAFLRRNLRLCGIDPYYTFNTKGKEETSDFRVPIARLSQERKEEARLQPGLVRTDEPVFHVPRIGKSHLRSWQDHEPIMILADGRRVYRFYPWESRLTLSKDYLYTDVSIFDYLKRLHLDGEDVDQYRTIWYYF